MLDLVRADRARAGVIPHDVVVLDVVVQLVIRADAKAELLAAAVMLAPEEEVRRDILDIAAAHAPREEREQVLNDSFGIAVAVPVHGAAHVAAAEFDLAARAHALPPHRTHTASSMPSSHMIEPMRCSWSSAVGSSCQGGR